MPQATPSGSVVAADSIRAAPETTADFVRAVPDGPKLRPETLSAGTAHYIAAFVISFSLLFFQVGVSRLLSVITWYHFSVLPITCAMLGLGVAGVLAHLVRDSLRGRAGEFFCALLSLLYAVSIPVSMLILFSRPISLNDVPFSAAIGQALLIFGAILLPLTLGGMTLTVVFHLNSANFARIYGVDFLGAALGSMAVFTLLSVLSTPGAMVATAVLAGIVPIAYAVNLRLRMFGVLSLGVFIALAALLQLSEQSHLLAPGYSKETRITPDQWQRWSAISHVRATQHNGYGNEHGLHPRYPREKTDYLDVVIDGSAGTTNNIWTDRAAFERFSRQFTADSFYLAHQLAPHHDRAVVIGSGAGMDVMAAKHFQFERVDAVDINRDVIRALRENAPQTYEWSYGAPGVKLHIDEGRDFIARGDQKFDLIQLVLVDTWAASASGALALAENHLYTGEAFGAFCEKLNDTGLLTVVRWSHEAPRLMNLAIEGLARIGITDPRDHVAMIANQRNSSRTVNLIVSRAPFTEEQRRQLRLAGDMFEVFFAPSHDDAATTADTASKAPLTVVSRGGHGKVGEIRFGDQKIELPQRGYHIGVLNAANSGLADIQSFDTCGDPAAAGKLADFINTIPDGTEVIVVAVDDASSALTESAVAALGSVGVLTPVAGQFNLAHAAIGVKGAFPGFAVEARPAAGEVTVSVPNARRISDAPQLLDHALLRSLLDPTRRAAVIAASPTDISPVFDDRPFFFLNTRGLSFAPPLSQASGNFSFTNSNALLTWMNAIVVLAVLLVVLAPLMAPQADRDGDHPNRWQLGSGLVYFAAIGVGFMWLEIVLLQKFILLLGHPVYSMTTILFSLLLGSGVGSLLGAAAIRRNTLTKIIPLIIAAYGVFVCYGVTPLIYSFIAVAPWMKVMLTVLCVASGGVVLGMALPLGRRVFESGGYQNFCWYWGVNGAASVLGASTGLLIATQSGYLVVGLSAVTAYVIAALALATQGFIKTHPAGVSARAAIAN